MTEKVRMPADLDQVTLKLLGRLDTKDLVRAALPMSAAFIYVYTASNPSTLAYTSLALAVVLGGTWALWRPWGRPLDQNVYQGLRWITQRDSHCSPDTEEEYIAADGSATALIEVDPVNMELKSGSEKAALHKLYQELLQTIDYPFTIYSSQKPFDFSSYLKDLDSSDRVQSNYRDYCKGLTDNGQSKIQHYVSIRVENGDTAELENRIDELLEKLNSGGLSAERINDIDRVGVNPEVNHDHVVYPDSGQRTHSKTVYVSEFPRDIDFSWTSQILQVEGLADITQVVKPKSSVDTISTLQKLENRAEAENQSLVRKGYGSSRRLERLLDDVDWFQNLLADQDDQPVEYGCYITAYGRDKEACEDTLRKVENRLKTLGINYRDTALRTDQAYQASTPGLKDKLDESLLVPAGSAASGFPFTQASTVDDNGVLFGVNQATEAPVILDRFKWNAGHQVLAGVTGSGKSFYSKLLLLRSSQIYDDLHIKIVDPKPEYGEVEELLEEYASVERFEFKGSISEDTEKLIQHVEEAYQSAQETDAKTIVVVDEAHRLLKTEQGASILSTLVREARSSNTAATLITQTVSDFYRTEDGKDILKNIPCKILFRHEEADNQIAEAFNLSSIAEINLYNLTEGAHSEADHSEAILSVSNQFESQIKIEASDTEASIIEDGELPEDASTLSETTIDKRQETCPTSTEESSRIQNLKESVAEAISGIDRPSLPDISFSSDGGNSSSQPDCAEEERSRDRSLPSPGFDRVVSAVKKTVLAFTALALLFIGITVALIIWEIWQHETWLAGPTLFTLSIGALLVYLTMKDIYSSREESLSDYTLNRVFKGAVVHTVVFSAMAAFFLVLPLTVVSEFAQSIADSQLRTGVYVAVAALELGVLRELGETGEETT